MDFGLEVTEWEERPTLCAAPVSPNHMTPSECKHTFASLSPSCLLSTARLDVVDL